MNEVDQKTRNKLLLRHVFVLLGGALFGLALAVFFLSLPIPYGWSLEKARSLGIMSQTIFDGYPKERDVIGYAALIFLTIGCALAAWWVWARKQKKLAFYMQTDFEIWSSPNRFIYLGTFALVVPLVIWFRPDLFRGPHGTWMLFGEEGMVLFAVNEILAGRTQGLDYFGLFGPMLTYPLAWLMTIVGRSLLIARYYAFALHLISYLVAGFILHRLVRRSSFAVFFVLLFIISFPVNLPVHSTYLRFTLGLLAVIVYCTGRSIKASVFSGLILGQSLLFSQEAGLCALITLVVVWLLQVPQKEKVREGFILVFSITASVAPFLLYVTCKGGFGALLHNMLEYPRLIALGYCALPFPGVHEAGSHYLFYWPIIMYCISILYAVPPLLLGCRNEHYYKLVAVSLYGMLLFRVALGRSDVIHVVNASPPAFFLVACLAEAFWDWLIQFSVIQKHQAIRLLSWCGLMSGVIGVIFPLVRAGTKTFSERSGLAVTSIDGTRKQMIGMTYPALSSLVGISLLNEDYAVISTIDRYLAACRKHDEYVYFFPNEPNLYFIFNLPSPSRFHSSYQAITREHRQEVINDLERRKPEYLVYNYNYSTRIDGIPELIQVPEILQYLQNNYSSCVKSDLVEIFARKGKKCVAN